MFDTFQHHLMQGWEFWAGLFAPLPYGDPFLAMATPIAIFIFATKWLIEGSVSGA